MRALLVLIALLAGSEARSQGLASSLNGGLYGTLATGINGGLQSGLVGAIGTLGQQPSNIRSASDLERLGIFLGGCAPGQVDLNHTGCRPLTEVTSRTVTTYDTSITGMRPLTDVTLQGLTLPNVVLNDVTLEGISGLTLAPESGAQGR